MTFSRQFYRSICANLFFVNINLNNGRFRSLGYQFVCLQNQSTIKSTTKNDRLTDEQKKLIDSMIRVDQAGEIGANWIYKGQMAVLGGDKKVGPVIQEMWEQEKHHLRTFDEMIPRYRVRPSLLRPVWEATGFILGVSTALMGKEAAMACTEAVETSFDSQLRDLLHVENVDVEDLKKIIKEFRDDELHHLDTAVDYESQKNSVVLLAAFKSLALTRNNNGTLKQCRKGRE
ncbi:9509_t:CDS:2 [Gigaspora margarita]|uniref:5-demethoxyubiquinone hydroxylase, mitochondrial n=1 Tax=Gigaspora margarita TaxID=4874 RepID=A0ABN7VDS1_GIGMA|nr:9509_t:CDS:2 [Gigaspora margarita]